MTDMPNSEVLWKLARSTNDQTTANAFIQASATYAVAEALSAIEMTLRGLKS